jgi:hypothetical protein
MGTDELVSQAAGELYASDLGEFTQRRAELAAQARAAGDRAAAKQIADLRKPTRSAWVVNQLVRVDASVPGRLAALAAEFRAGQAAADGTALRRLSQDRRKLIDDLVRQALSASGEHAPSAALRDEVTATLAAALTNPEVADRLATGTLTRAEHQAELGSFAGAPFGASAPPPERGQAAGAAPNRAASAARDRAAEAARERAERQRQQAIARAERALEDARLAADAAAEAEQGQEHVVREIEHQLAEARLRLQQAQLRARQAAAAHRNAAQALRRLPQ